MNVPLFGYVYIPLVEDNVNFPSALSIFATFVTVVVGIVSGVCVFVIVNPLSTLPDTSAL